MKLAECRSAGLSDAREGAPVPPNGGAPLERVVKRHPVEREQTDPWLYRPKLSGAFKPKWCQIFVCLPEAHAGVVVVREPNFRLFFGLD